MIVTYPKKALLRRILGIGSFQIILRACQKNQLITITGNTTYASSSQSLELAKRWYPYDLFRFYKNNKYKYVITNISIILDEDPWVGCPPVTPINEPLITAGYFHYKKGEKIKVDYWWGRTYEQSEDRVDYGTYYIFEDWDKESPIQSSEHFGHPLTSVNTATNVESKIVKPLLELLPKLS